MNCFQWLIINWFDSCDNSWLAYWHFNVVWGRGFETTIVVVCVIYECCLICALQAICTCFFLSMCLTRVCLAHYVRVLWYFCRFLLFSWLFGFVCLLFSKTVFVFYKIVRLLSTFESCLLMSHDSESMIFRVCLDFIGTYKLICLKK